MSLEIFSAGPHDRWIGDVATVLNREWGAELGYSEAESYGR